MKKEEMGLALKGSAKFGKLLVEEAVKENREKLQKSVIGIISRKLQQIEETKDMIAKMEASQKFLESQVAALEAGDFTVERDGTIKFSDESLSKQIDWVSTCQSCGYKKYVVAPA